MDRAVFDIFNKTIFLLKHFRPKIFVRFYKNENSNQRFNGFVKNVSKDGVWIFLDGTLCRYNMETKNCLFVTVVTLRRIHCQASVVAQYTRSIRAVLAQYTRRTGRPRERLRGVSTTWLVGNCIVYN